MKYCPNTDEHIKTLKKEKFVRADFEFPEGFDYCTECGAKLLVPEINLCKCGKVKTEYRFCPFCGIKN
jgi:hypothetical protein